MRRYALNLLLLLALIFQGVAAVGADAFSGGGEEQHCAGHASDAGTCVCCPEGSAMNAGCTVQCSVAQAAIAMMLPAFMAGQSVRVQSDQRAIDNPCYAPLIPPPIS